MGRVILDSDDEGHEEQIEDETLTIPGEQNGDLAREDNSSDQRLQLVMEETHAELVKPTPSQKRKRARDDATLTPRTSAKKLKLRRISSTGTPVDHIRPLGDIDPNAAVCLPLATGANDDHETQGGDTELASSTMPRLRLDLEFREHDPRTLFLYRSTNGNESSDSAVIQELAEHTTDVSTQQNSTATFPSLEDASQVHENQIDSKETPHPTEEPNCSGLANKDYLNDMARSCSVPIVDILGLKRTSPRVGKHSSVPFPDSPDELAMSGDICAHNGNIIRKARATTSCSQKRSEDDWTLRLGRRNVSDDVRCKTYNDKGDSDPTVVGKPTCNSGIFDKEQPDKADSAEAKASCRPIGQEHPKRKRGRPRIGKTSKSDNERSDSLEGQGKDLIFQQQGGESPRHEEQPPADNGKKRGRPKKIQAPEVTEEPAQNENNGIGPSHKESESKPDKVGSGVSGMNPPGSATDATHSLKEQPQKMSMKEIDDIGLLASPDGEGGTTLQSTPTKSSAAEPKAPSHSPLNKGRVPFKVGLSKRARIEPLLRVVKK